MGKTGICTYIVMMCNVYTKLTIMEMGMKIRSGDTSSQQTQATSERVLAELISEKKKSGIFSPDRRMSARLPLRLRWVVPRVLLRKCIFYISLTHMEREREIVLGLSSALVLCTATHFLYPSTFLHSGHRLILR